MNDIEKSDGYYSRSALARQGITAIIYSASGVLLFVLQFLARFRALGLVLGAALCIWGIISIKSKDPAATKPGILIASAGVLTILSKTGVPALQIISGALLTMGAFGLLAMGLVNAVKFFAGLNNRS